MGRSAVMMLPNMKMAANSFPDQLDQFRIKYSVTRLMAFYPGIGGVQVNFTVDAFQKDLK